MARQSRIPGTDADRIKEIDDAAEAYVEQRDARMALTKKEKEAKDGLLQVMKKHKLDVYRDDRAVPALVVTFVPGEDDVKVSKAKEEDDAGSVDAEKGVDDESGGGKAKPPAPAAPAKSAVLPPTKAKKPKGKKRGEPAGTKH